MAFFDFLGLCFLAFLQRYFKDIDRNGREGASPWYVPDGSLQLLSQLPSEQSQGVGRFVLKCHHLRSLHRMAGSLARIWSALVQRREPAIWLTPQPKPHREWRRPVATSRRSPVAMPHLDHPQPDPAFQHRPQPLHPAHPWQPRVLVNWRACRKVVV